jgi:hypothetical protein
MRVANSVLRPSNRNESDRFSAGGPFCGHAEGAAAADDDEGVREVDGEPTRDQGGQKRAHTAPSARPADQGNCQKRGQNDGDVKGCG